MARAARAWGPARHAVLADVLGVRSQCYAGLSQKGAGLRGIDYVLGAALVAIVVLAIASMIGVPLGPVDPALLMTRALDALTPA